MVRDVQLPTKREAITAYFAALPVVPRPSAPWSSPPRPGTASATSRGQGVDLRLAHSKHVKAISYAKAKTDAVDAATLAQLLRGDLVARTTWSVPCSAKRATCCVG